MTIESDCPEVTVMENTEHPSIMSIISQPTARTPFAKLSFPKTGSFEVYFRGKIIFSKLRLGIWPHPAMVAKNIREIIDGKEDPKAASATQFRETQSKPEVPRKPASSLAKKEPEFPNPEPRKQENSKQPDPPKAETPKPAKLPEVVKKDVVAEKKEAKAESQVKPQEVLVKPVEVPAKHVELPAKPVEIPVKHEELPAKHEETPVRHEEAVVKHEEAKEKVKITTRDEEIPPPKAVVPEEVHHKHPELPHDDHKAVAPIEHHEESHEEPYEEHHEEPHEEHHEDHKPKAEELSEKYESQQSVHEEEKEVHEEAGSAHEEYSGDEEAEEDAVPPYTITDSFKIDLAVGQGKNAKIPVKAHSEEDVTYQVQVTNTRLVKVEKSEIVVPTGGNEKLKVEILPQEETGITKSYIVLSTPEAVVACYEIVVEVS